MPSVASAEGFQLYSKRKKEGLGGVIPVCSKWLQSNKSLALFFVFFPSL